MPPTVQVAAPSRLHFGMFSFGRPELRSFGGVGVMLDRPGVRLSIAPCGELSVTGPLADRARKFAQAAVEAWRLSEPLCCRITIESAPRDHVGLGVGTQLALSVAAGLERFLGRPRADAIQLARDTGRSARSAVGTYGFQYGGLIVEAGKSLTKRDATSPLVRQMAIPHPWRFVLFCPRRDQGLFGDEEQRAFRELPPVPLETTDTLCRLALLEIVPAVAQGDFDRFSHAVYEYGRLAGGCFAPTQGGAYASDQIARLVEQLRRREVAGVGQSSWGPTVFAATPSAHAAQLLIERFSDYEPDQWEMILASPCNAGARISTESAPPDSPPDSQSRVDQTSADNGKESAVS